MSQETDDHMAAEMHLFRKLEREAADWKGLAERRRDELSGILEDVRALSAEKAGYLAKIEALTQACDAQAGEIRKIETRYESAMLQIRDTHGALNKAGVACELHTAHDGCPTQLGHRVRFVIAHALHVEKLNDSLVGELSTLRAALTDLQTGAEQQSQSHADVLCKCRAALGD